MLKKLSVNEEIAKERKDLWESKIAIMMGHMGEVVEEDVKIYMEEWLVKWVQDMEALAE